MMLGLTWGLVAWASMDDILLRLIRAARVVTSMSVATAIAEHFVFGLSVAVGVLPIHPRRST